MQLGSSRERHPNLSGRASRNRASKQQCCGRSASSMTIMKVPKAFLIDVFKMPNASAGAAYDLGVKIFGRAVCLQTMG